MDGTSKWIWSLQTTFTQSRFHLFGEDDIRTEQTKCTWSRQHSLEADMNTVEIYSNQKVFIYSEQTTIICSRWHFLRAGNMWSKLMTFTQSSWHLLEVGIYSEEMKITLSRQKLLTADDIYSQQTFSQTQCIRHLLGADIYSKQTTFTQIR